MRYGVLIATIPWLVGPPFASGVVAAGTFGDLPAGASSVSEQSGVHAEICRDHLLDPATVEARLPDGYRFATTRELAGDDPHLAALIQKVPRYAGYAVGSLCFMLPDSFLVDGVRANLDGPTPMAFWWARVTPQPDLVVDPRMKGRIDWVQLGSWYSSRGTDHTLIRRTDPMAQFVELRVDEVSSGHWLLRMALHGAVVSAAVETLGPRIRRDAPQPGYMTVLFSGERADQFTVFTYFGHHHREAQGRWSAEGRTALTDALQSGADETFGTFFQEGWQARAGLYRRGSGKREGDVTR